MANVQRLEPLQSRLFSIDGVSLTPKPQGERMVLRAQASQLAKIGRALSVTIPKKPKTSVSKNGLSVLWIGPDEWLLLADDGFGLADKLSEVKSNLFSAVDVSHRNTGIEVAGPMAETTLSSGCPQNLQLNVFPIAAVSRTLFGKAEVVLFRVDEQRFHLECWRSFSDYVWKFLVDAAKSA